MRKLTDPERESLAEARAILAALDKRKEWVGLTDEEMRLIRSDFHGSLDTNAYCRAIQNKLKEKNNG